MNEEEENESSNSNDDKGNKSKKINTIERANIAAERLEKANEEAREILARQEEIISKRILGGESEAGKEQEKPKEETPKEYAERILRG